METKNLSLYYSINVQNVDQPKKKILLNVLEDTINAKSCKNHSNTICQMKIKRKNLQKPNSIKKKKIIILLSCIWIVEFDFKKIFGAKSLKQLPYSVKFKRVIISEKY